MNTLAYLIPSGRSFVYVPDTHLYMSQGGASTTADKVIILLLMVPCIFVLSRVCLRVFLSMMTTGVTANKFIIFTIFGCLNSAFIVGFIDILSRL